MTAPEAAAQVETLVDLLPPANEDLQELISPDEYNEAPARTVAPLTDDDLQHIEEHITNVMHVVATNSADMLPAAVRQQYVDGYMSSTLIRNGVRMSGLGEVLHELLPPAGKPGAGAPGAVRQLHPALRIVLGIAALGLGAFLQQKAALASHHTG